MSHSKFFEFVFSIVSSKVSIETSILVSEVQVTNFLIILGLGTFLLKIWESSTKKALSEATNTYFVTTGTILPSWSQAEVLHMERAIRQKRSFCLVLAS